VQSTGRPRAARPRLAPIVRTVSLKTQLSVLNLEIMR